MTLFASNTTIFIYIFAVVGVAVAFLDCETL